jgi:hypothetical protein
MIDLNDKDLKDDIEELIHKLPSILSCKVVINEEGKIVEVHILSSNERSPKQIARDIQSSLMAKWGIQIDHKIISIAQIADKEGEKSRYKLIISQVEYSVEGINAEALVVLKHQENTYIGKKKGLHTRNGVAKLIANATIKAVEEYLGKGPCFSIEDIEKTRIAKRDAAMVAVSLLTNFEEKYFIGASYINSDEHKSIVKSTLNALNTFIDKI